MSVCKKEESIFTNADGKKIACRYWTPKDEIRALVFISHGAGEHCDCYDNVANSFNERGFKVFSHDHLGHGLSEGDRVHIGSFSHYTRDIFQHVEQVQKDHPGIPCFILGHSMGGCIAIKATMDKPDVFKGMLLIGPAVVPNPETASPFKITMAKVLSRVIPQCPVAAIQEKHISQDPVIVEKYKQDPLVWHGKLKAKWAMEIFNTMKYICEHMDQVTAPMLVIQGTEDKLVEKSGASLLQEKAGSKDKTVKMVEGAFHQVHNEPDGVGKQCINDMSQWISERC